MVNWDVWIVKIMHCKIFYFSLGKIEKADMKIKRVGFNEF